MTQASSHERELYVLVPPYSSDEQSYIRLIARATRAYRWLLLGFVVSGVATGWLVYFLSTPVYVVSATLAPQTEDESSGVLAGLGSQVGGLAALAGISLDNASQQKEEAIAILNSKSFAYAFFRERNLLPELFPEKWNNETKRWTTDAEDTPTMGDAWELFDRHVRDVHEDRKTGMVTLSIEWTDRVEAVEWTGELVSRLNEVMRRRAIEEAETSLTYLNRELDKSSSIDIRQAIYRLIETQIKKVMLANVRAEYSMRVIDPPVMPDADRFDRPKVVPAILLGGICGLLLGAIASAFLWTRQHARSTPIAS